jgi:hypothetical protein
MVAKTIKNKIKTALETLEGSTVQQVYGYIEPLPKMFPCVMIDLYRGNKDAAYTNRGNMQEFRWIIHAELRGKNSEANAEQRLDLLDSILGVLNGSTYAFDMGNTCDIFMVEQIESFNDDQSESPKIGFDITCVTKTLVTIT